MKKRIFSSVISVFLVFTMVSSVVLPEAVNPIKSSAASSVYDFDYGSGISWPKGQDFPTFSPITVTEDNPMDAIDISNKSTGVQYAMYTLQGLVNRESPRLLVESGAREGWPEKLIGESKIRRTSDYKSLINKYKYLISGIIIYDESSVHTMNVATSMAGVENCIVVSPSIATEVRSATGLAVKFDLRNYDLATKSKAYNWLYDNYYAKGKLTTRLILGLNPTDHLKNRDMAVALKAAVLWMNPRVNSDKTVMDKFYSQATPGVTYHLGWWTSEDDGVIYGTQNGVSTVPSDHFENMTVYAATSRKLEVPTVPAKPKLQNKLYVALAVSDGDNTQYNEHVMYDRWNENNRTKMPISWTISPALYYLAPQMLNYYYKTAGDNSAFIAGPSGLGYTKTTRWSDKEGFLDQYVKATDNASEKTGINIITLWDRISASNFKKFASKTKTTVALTINNNPFNDKDESNPDYMYSGGQFIYYPENGSIEYSNNIPLLALGPGAGYIESQSIVYDVLKGMAENYDGKKPMFRMLQAVPWKVTTTQLYDIYTRINKEYPGKIEFVRADHLFMLANEYYKKPYNIALRASVKASYTDKGSSASKGVDGSFTTGWSASKGKNKWYQVDFGKVCTINRYVLKNAETGYFKASQNTKAYKFEYSCDGVNWKVADSVSGNKEDILYRSFKKAITARYVRIKFVNPGSSGVARIQDLEVYGNAVEVSKDLLKKTVKTLKGYKKSRMTTALWKKLQKSIKSANTVISKSKSAEYQSTYSNLMAIKSSIDSLVPVKKVSVKKSTVSVPQGKSIKLSVTVTPKNAYNKTLTFKTSNKNVAKVKSGKIYGVNGGTAKITISAGGKKATVKVYVDGLSKDKKALYKSGKKLKNKWMKVNGKWYYADSNGVVVKTK